MGIYYTIRVIKVETSDYVGTTSENEFRKIIFRAVPGSVGHPGNGYDEDPYKDSLPPPPANMDDLRAVVVLQEGHTDQGDGLYTEPLFVLSGKEYLEIPFVEMTRRIHLALKKVNHE
jgi:hypothetical protein